MDLRFRSPLSLHECTQRLHDAIDPIPPQKERARSAWMTTWAVSPLSAAGQRTTGFGYTPGTRPVVGTFTENHFRLERKAVASRGQVPIIRAVCIGELTPTENGTQIAANIQRPLTANTVGSGCALLMGIGLFSLATMPALLRLLFGIDILGAGGPSPSNQDLTFTFCFTLVFLLGGLGMLFGEYSAFQQEARYLIRFVEQVCTATPTAASVPIERAYTGKTRRLR